MNTARILNIEIDDVPLHKLLAELKQGIVFTPNVDHLVKLQRDRKFFEAYCAADYTLCDSKILFFVSKLLGSSISEKISGADLLPAFYRYHQHNPSITLFLLGAAEGVAAEAQAKINAKVGRQMVVGTYSPPFAFEQNADECQRIIQAVNQSKATVLVVGLGAPKQEKFIHRHKGEFRHIKIFLALGATLNFEAGKVQRAPKIVSEIGLEWLYRLASEPARLWKRYLLEDPVFFWLILLQLFDRYHSPFPTSDFTRAKLDRVARSTSSLF